VAELIAIGKGTQRQSRRELREGERLLLGRAPRNGWSIPWDRLISREHANVELVGGALEVSQLETARNPIFFDGQPCTSFTVEPESAFRIGETTFHFRTDATGVKNDPLFTEHVFEESSAISPFANPTNCLQTLCKMPGIIAKARTSEQLAEQVVELLLDSLRGSLAAAVMEFDSAGDGQSIGEPSLLRWSSRGDEVDRFKPSRKLMKRAFERSQSVVHLWMEGQDPDSHFTMDGDLDWAFCTPIPVDSTQRWCLYVSGRRRFGGIREVRSPDDLIGELRLAELVAQFIGAVRRVRSLEQQQTEMRQFFSPAVIEQLTNTGTTDSLEPRMGPASVLFCDVRGFSRKVEESGANLKQLLAQVSEALTAMTRSILKYEGVIADFQGDAALAFWGWPSHSPEAALLSCRAALQIASLFERAEHDLKSPLHGFRVGLGLTFGEAIAGRIGSDEQIKVGVFGTVVNLAARLQDLTKQLGVPILVDAGVVQEVGKTLPETEGSFRRLARLRPAGMNTSTEIYALTPAESAVRGLSSELLAAYDHAIDAVIAGNWTGARDLLESLPDDDGPSCFIRSLLASADYQPPDDWDGALSMAGKGEVRLR